MTDLEKKPVSMEKIETVLIKGDLSVLSEAERLNYYKSVCESVGLNVLTKPFEYITLNGRLTLYATKAATDQLRSIHKISVVITSREKIADVYVVTAKASTPDGRCDESTGVVALGKAFGDALANLYMKAETKAKRRVTLSICGLGMLDETEVESIPSVQRQSVPIGLVPKTIETSTPKVTPDVSEDSATVVDTTAEAVTGEHVSAAVAEESQRELSTKQVNLWKIRTRGMAQVDLEMIYRRFGKDATSWKTMSNFEFNCALALVELAQRIGSSADLAAYNRDHEKKWYDLSEQEAKESLREVIR